MTDPVVVTAEKLSKVYHGPDGEVRAVDGIDLELRAGEFVAVHGPSGCGKSTLLLMIGTLLQPDLGRIVVAGVDPFALTPNERAAFRVKHIGFVFQQFHLLPYLNVVDNVLVSTTDAPLPDARERAEALLTRFSLQDRLRHVPSALSTGERQRVALARALMHSPAVVLADEPTGNLDGDNAQAVLGHLSEIAANGSTVLMVTHDREALAAADRSVRLENGSVVTT